jgi:hypothetical protein
MKGKLEEGTKVKYKQTTEITTVMLLSVTSLLSKSALIIRQKH